MSATGAMRLAIAVVTTVLAAGSAAYAMFVIGPGHPRLSMPPMLTYGVAPFVFATSLSLTWPR